MANEEAIEKEMEEAVIEEERNALSYVGQIFRILFYLTLLYLVWRFFPFSLDRFELTLKGILEPFGSIVLIVVIFYSLITPHKEDYENWGWFAIWLTLGVGALYLLTFIL
jgi:hypothetical protein